MRAYMINEKAMAARTIKEKEYVKQQEELYIANQKAMALAKVNAKVE